MEECQGAHSLEVRDGVHRQEDEYLGAHSREAQDGPNSLESNLDRRGGLEEAVSFSAMSPRPGWKSSQVRRPGRGSVSSKSEVTITNNPVDPQ